MAPTLPAEGSALGTIAKFVATPNISEIGADKRRQVIVDRFSLQAEARRLLSAQRKPPRVCTCLRSPVPGAPFVELHYLPELQRGRFRKLMVCRGLWVCPICAAIITEKRRIELKQVVEAARASNLRVLLVTLTFSHRAGEPLGPMLDKLLGALRWLTRQRRWVKLRDRSAFVGWVRALECTYRMLNGWHPHLHLLMFLPVGIDAEAFGWAFQAQWRMALRHFGLDCDMAHGCNVKDTNEAVAEYLQKWGHERSWGEDAELTKSHVKRGHEGSQTPWGLLRASSTGDTEAGELFREYAAAFKGRNQLRATPGLYELLLGEAQKEDDELMDESEAVSQVLAWVRSAFWPEVVGQDALPELQMAMDTGDAGEVLAVLGQLGLPFGSYGAAVGLERSA